MFHISTTPSNKRLPNLEDVKEVKESGVKTLDEELNDQKKVDGYGRSKAIQDNLTFVVTKLINPGIFIFLFLLMVFCFALYINGEIATLIVWIERTVTFTIGGIVLPYIAKHVELKK